MKKIIFTVKKCKKTFSFTGKRFSAEEKKVHVFYFTHTHTQAYFILHTQALVDL